MTQSKRTLNLIMMKMNKIEVLWTIPNDKSQVKLFTENSIPNLVKFTMLLIIGAMITVN